MVAPLPFFQSRGAPFQVYHRAKALGKLGHQIDLVTYAVGEDVDLPNVQIHRALPVPFVRQVKVGPSLAKFPLDTLLFLKTVEMLLRRRYDCIHTHLEAGFFGAVLSRPFRLPHVYDMHDDLAETLASSKFTKNKALIGMMRWVVKTTLRSARVIIIDYPELQNTVDALAPGKPTVMIHNTAVTADDAVDASEQAYNTAELLALRRSLGVPERAPLLLYTGTFEPYQGLGELVRSMPAVLADYPDAHYLLVGGLPHQIAEIADLARSLGVEQSLHLPGRRSHEEMPKFMAMADILLCPRSEGTNTHSNSFPISMQAKLSWRLTFIPIRRSSRQTLRCWWTPLAQHWPRAQRRCSAIRRSANGSPVTRKRSQSSNLAMTPSSLGPPRPITCSLPR